MHHDTPSPHETAPESPVALAHWKRHATLYLASQAISLFGTVLVQLAITWYITLRTQSGSMMTISILCAFVPTLLISPFAGVWADRYDRKLLIAVSDTMIALCTLAIALLFLAGYDAVWLLFVASAIRSFGSGIQMPAVGAFLPQFVPQEHLMKVNAINGSIQSALNLFAPMLSAALLTVASIEAIFFVDVVTAAIAVTILLGFLRVPPHKRVQETQQVSYFADLRSGIAYISRHGYLKAFFLFNAVFFTFLGPLAFLTPLQITRTFGDEVWRLSAMEVGFSLGMLLGGLLMASWGGFRNRLCSMATANFIIGVCAVVLGLPPSFVIYVLTVALSGLVVPVFNTPATVMLQERVESEYLGRVFGVSTMISSSLLPLSMLIFGPLADIIAIEGLLLISGGAMILQSVLMFANHDLKKAGEPVAGSAPAT